MSTKTSGAGSVLDLVTDDAALSAAAAFSELGLDEFLAGGILRDVPVLGTIVGLCKTGSGVAGYLFTRKLLRFLKSFEQIPEAERRAFAEKIANSPVEKRRLQVHLLLVVERLDDIEKSGLVARAFLAYLREEVTRRELDALLNSIDRCFVGDLEHHQPGLRTDQTGTPLNGEAILLRLASCGLVAATPVHPTREYDSSSSSYTITSFGTLFHEVVIAELAA